ncbi:Protein CMSS1-like [Quillaja saponaria]|uniref:Protein CMSS1-like n=1 Tax=Quillaja saponaria TaxID=32244 RepID=A0AAD7VKQ5_QUISA|nr:Protein CMSS1-like [Quillaja saponaria]
MGSRKEQKPLKTSLRNPKRPRRRRLTLIDSKDNNVTQNKQNIESDNNIQPASASEQLRFFLDQFQSAKGLQLSSLERESIKDTCMLELTQGSDHDVKTLGKDIKAAFGKSWKEVLYDGQLLEGKIDAGSPAVLIVSYSALRSIELLRGFRSLTGECCAVKLFSKHMKVEEQVQLLKNRVNIASGTPSRIKKLIDIEALGLSRLQVLLLDMYPDVKGYSLFSLPQVRDEFWELYKNYFYERMVRGDLRVCLYGPYQLAAVHLKGKRGLPND